MHEELRTQGKLDLCSWQGQTNRYCWFASVTSASSTATAKYTTSGTECVPSGTPNKLGACFEHNEDPPDHLIATIPYEYNKDWDCNPGPMGTTTPGGPSCRYGYKQHSNILRGVNGGDSPYYYMLAEVSGPLFTGPGDTQVARQEAGICLLRTTDVSQPDLWLAWDGDNFGARPATDAVAPNDNLCKPVTSGIDPWSLTYNTYLKKYMVLSTGVLLNPAGVYYRLSDDLLNWSEPQLVMEARLRSDAGRDCRFDAVTYPVILDPNDPANPATPTSPLPSDGESINFERPGARPDLYFHHIDYVRNDANNPAEGCYVPESGSNPNWKAANIARLPIDFRPQRQATLHQALVHPETGYDTNFSMSSGCGLSYDTEGGCATASVLPNFSTNSYGRVFTRWNDPLDKRKSDVWYGSAFRLPDNLFDVASGWLLRWYGQNNSTGGLVIDTADDDSLQVVLDRTGCSTCRTVLATVDADEVPTVGDAPGDEADWVWIEVHQRFDSTSAAPLTELYLNGKLVSSSVIPNIHADTRLISEAAFGFNEMNSSAGLIALTMSVDRSTILGGQRGDLRAGGTPIGLREATGSTTLMWNERPPIEDIDAYSVYKLENGTWTVKAPNITSSSYTDPACSSGDQYRVTSVKNGIESIVSTPLMVSEC